MKARALELFLLLTCFAPSLLLLQSFCTNTSSPVGRWHLTLWTSLVQQQCSDVGLSVCLVDLSRIEINKQDCNTSGRPRRSQEFPVPSDRVAGM